MKSNINFRIVEDLKECEEIWNSLSEKKSIWDLWEFNRCFFIKKMHEPFFIVKYDENNNPIGFLPLWYDNSDDTYCFFGGYFPEKRIFFLDKSEIKDYLKQISKDEYVTLWDVGSSEKDCLPFTPGETRFFINLEKYGFNIENYFATFKKKHRKNLKYDLKKLEEKFKPEIRMNYLDDYPRLVELNKMRFGKESDFREKEHKDGMKRLIKYAHKKGMLNFISIIIDGKVEASEIAVIYNNVYYVLGGGANLKIKNLGKYLNMTHIKQAIEKKIAIVDFMTSDSGWKRLWNLEEEQLYNYMNYDENYKVIPIERI